ncbi:unnamed protein product [Ectocarpus sp. CCAP 1310/34]|nr:unnamed protein product [Ectocarpus sp. CCAP 1310/34]
MGSYAGWAAGLRNQWAGSLRPREQQPLAPKDLLLMLRPNSEGFFDCDGADKKGGTQAAHMIGAGAGGWGGGGAAAAAATKMAVSVVGGGGGGDEGDRRSSWSDSREACREAGELLRAIRRDSAPAAAVAPSSSPKHADGGRQTRPDTPEGPTAVAPLSSPKHAGGGGERGERNNVPGDLEQGRRWRDAGRRLPEGHGGSGGGGGGGDTDHGYVESFTSNWGRFDHSGHDGRLASTLPSPGLALRECHREYFHRADTTAATAAPALQPSHRIPPGGYPYNRSQDHQYPYQARTLHHQYHHHASTTTTTPLHGEWNATGRRSPAAAAPPSFAQVVLAAHPPFPGGGGTGDQRDSGGKTGAVSSERCWKGGHWSVPAALSGAGHHGGPFPISIPVPVPDHHAPPPVFGRVGGPFREGSRGARSLQ